MERMKNTKEIKPDYIEIVEEFKKKLRNTKVKGMRLFYIIDLVYMNAATKKQLIELKKLKKEIPDWELEADYYRTMYGPNEEREMKELIAYMYGHHC